MPRNDPPPIDGCAPTTYELKVRGRLPISLAQDLDGFTVDAGPTTTITGPVADSAALYGLVARIECLGLTLLSIQPIATGTTSPSPADPGRSHRHDHDSD